MLLQEVRGTSVLNHSPLARNSIPESDDDSAAKADDSYPDTLTNDDGVHSTFQDVVKLFVTVLSTVYGMAYKSFIHVYSILHTHTNDFLNLHPVLRQRLSYGLYIAQLLAGTVLCIRIAGWFLPMLAIVLPLVALVVGVESAVGADWYVGRKVREAQGMVREWLNGNGGVDDGMGQLDGADDQAQAAPAAGDGGKVRLVISEMGVRVMRG